MKQSFTGGYDLETIKWFTPEGLTLSFTCLHCGETFTVDAGDDFIEYPKATNKMTMYCNGCESSFDVTLNITMAVTIEVVTVEA